MENFYSRIRNLKLLNKHEINSILFSFTKKEWFVFIFLIIALFIGTVAILENVNKSLMTNVPMQGGSLSEGIIGTPRFVNPILAFSDADRDLTSLVYSGLMRKDVDGILIPDLAEKYEMSKDGLIYTFTLKDNIYFHDGKPVTADDIIFTINEVKDPVIKNSHKANWDGISVEKLDNKTIQFTLKKSYAAFLENATIGIMPAHVWNNSLIELNDANINPIGSGPYMISSVSKQSSGIIDYYELSAFKKFSLGKPYIKNITLKFYQNETDLVSAFEKTEVSQISSITPANAENLKNKEYRIESSTLPRVFGLFFNQNQNQLFIDKNITSAINKAIDKDRIVKEVLGDYGVVIDDPIPPNMVAYQRLSVKNTISYEDNVKKAEEILAKDGWKKGTSGFLEKTIVNKSKKKVITPLEFSISTGNAPELAQTAELIKENLGSIGIKVDVKTFEVGNLNQGVIRPRKYDALLFGQIINHESELFAFWHSTQRKDPGLNVAMYTNAKVDKILEDAFTTIDDQSRIKKYGQFEDEIKKDMPAIFLYSPNFIYAISKNLKGISIDHIISPSDRFLNSYLWYIDTDSVWKIFSK